MNPIRNELRAKEAGSAELLAVTEYVIGSISRNNCFIIKSSTDNMPVTGKRMNSKRQREEKYNFPIYV